MARSVSSDPLLAHNFALIDVPVPGLLPLAFPIKTILSAAQAGTLVGFSEIDLPTATIEMKEIKEGNWPRVHRVPVGFVNSGQVTLRQAVLPYATDMYLWFVQAQWGRIAPRRDLLVAHLRSEKSVPYRLIKLEGCIPESWTPSSPLSASNTEVATEELVLQVANVEIVPLTSPVGRPNS